MTREEALQRIVDNNYSGEYEFDLRILINCMGFAREIILNSQSQSEDCINIPEGATNGDAFQILFQCNDVIEDGLQDGFVDISMKSDPSIMYTFKKDWWNSPHKRGTE